jgi:hypothetical protein
MVIPPQNWWQMQKKISTERSKITKFLTEDNIDLAISILSTTFQIVPGLGTVIGTVIEFLHAISYFIRFFYYVR